MTQQVEIGRGNGTQNISIGVDVGGTKIATGVLRAGELHDRHVQPTPETGWEGVLDAIAAQSYNFV